MSVKTSYRQGRTEFDTRAFQDYAVRYAFTFHDLVANILRIPVEANKWIHSVRLHVVTGFAGATDCIIGDTEDDNGYLTVTDLTQALVRTNGFVIDSQDKYAMAQAGAADYEVTITPNAYAAGGRFYADGSQLMIEFSGTVTAGAAVLEIMFDGYEPARADMLVNQ